MKAAKSAKGLGIATEVGRKPGGGIPGKSGGGGAFMPGTVRAERRSADDFGIPKNPFPAPNCLCRSTGESPPKTRDIVRGVMRVSVTL